MRIISLIFFIVLIVAANNSAFAIENKDDVNKVLFAKHLADIGKIDSSLLLIREVLAEMEQKDKHDSAARLYIQISDLHLRKNNKDSAVANAIFGVSKAEEAESEVTKGVCYRQLGKIYGMNGEYYACMSYLIKAKEIFERAGDANELARVTMNMGIVFRHMGLNDQAIEHFKKALDISSDKAMLGRCMANISSVYMDRGNYTKALEFLTKSEKTFKELDDLPALANVLSDQGFILMKLERLEESEIVAIDALKIAQKLKLNVLTNQTLLLLAEIYYNKGNTNRALHYLSLADSGMVNNFSHFATFHKVYSDIYTSDGNYEKAIRHYTLYTNYVDSINTQKNNNELRDISSRYELDNKEKEIALLTKDQEIQTLELGQSKQELATFRSALIFGGLAAVLLIASVFLIYGRYKSRKTLSEELETKNKQITRSINYAKRIQTALLPSRYALVDYFEESFIYYKPKEIVSGDFYWVAKQGNTILIAVADCTGHGIPGAFISMIGSTLLNEIVNQNHITSPAEILHELDKTIVHTLGQTNVNLSTKSDGMDIGICAYDRTSHSLQFAGANHSLTIISNKTPKVLKGTLSPIGGYAKDIKKEFHEYKESLSKGDIIYMYTDGFFDQFGGEKRKKYMSQRFRNLLIDVSKLSCDLQKAKLEEEFMNWKGDLSQTDDILVAGFKI